MLDCGVDSRSNRTAALLEILDITAAGSHDDLIAAASLYIVRLSCISAAQRYQFFPDPSLDFVFILIDGILDCSHHFCSLRDGIARSIGTMSGSDSAGRSHRRGAVRGSRELRGSVRSVEADEERMGQDTRPIPEVSRATDKETVDSGLNISTCYSLALSSARTSSRTALLQGRRTLLDRKKSGALLGKPDEEDNQAITSSLAGSTNSGPNKSVRQKVHDRSTATG